VKVADIAMHLLEALEAGDAAHGEPAGSTLVMPPTV
jgi:hypothetical protein